MFLLLVLCVSYELMLEQTLETENLFDFGLRQQRAVRVRFSSVI